MNIDYDVMKLAIINAVSNIEKKKQGEYMSTSFSMTSFDFGDMFSVHFTTYTEDHLHSVMTGYDFDSRHPGDAEAFEIGADDKVSERKNITMESALKDICYHFSKRGVDFDEFI